MRQCAPEEMKHGCDDVKEEFASGTTCFCNGNLCNAGSAQIVNILALVTMAIGAIAVSLIAFRR